MALPSELMPATLPDWRVAPHSLTLRGPFASVAVVVGHPRKRRTANVPPRAVRAELLLTEAQATALHDWHEGDLEAGALPFSARVLADDGTRQWWHARFAQPLEWEAVAARGGPRWRVSALLRLQGYPSSTQPT